MIFILLLLLFIINNTEACNCTISDEYKDLEGGNIFILGILFIISGYSLFFSWQNYNSIKKLRYSLIQ